MKSKKTVKIGEKITFEQGIDLFNTQMLEVTAGCETPLIANATKLGTLEAMIRVLMHADPTFVSETLMLIETEHEIHRLEAGNNQTEHLESFKSKTIAETCLNSLQKNHPNNHYILVSKIYSK